jgi:hypothetical protein
VARKTGVPVKRGRDVATKVAEAILGFVGDIPNSTETVSRVPVEAARRAANTAAAKAAMTAGALALPVGPLGWLTILPELVAVWKIQARMVADIAALYGKKATLTPEHMLYCLFRHSAAQAVRDLVARAGQRYLIKRTSLRLIEEVAQQIGLKVTQQALGKGLARWIPIAGAVGVGAYAYYDTAQVARTAIKLFESDIEVEPAPRGGAARND